MSEFTELTISNFNQVQEAQLAALAKDRFVLKLLHERCGVNPTLDTLTGAEENFAQGLFEDISEGIRRAAVVEGADSKPGLVVVSSGVEVRESIYGRLLIKGTCVEAVTASEVCGSLAELYRIGTDLAFESGSRTNVFAIEKHCPPKVSQKSDCLPEFNPRESQEVRRAIGSVLPLLDSPNWYFRSDYKSARNQLTEVMSLRLVR